MPTPTIPAGNLFMNATTYTGTGSTLAVTNGVAGQSFQPDMVWIKERSQAQDHALFDSVRGATKQLSTNTNTGEATYANSMSAFNSNGFSVVSDAVVNSSGQTYVGWNWKAGGTAVSNTSGSITTSVSANTTSGFSIITYGGASANSTIGHGLGAVPSMYIVKRLSGSPYDWYTYHISLGNTQWLRLNTTGAATTYNLWQNTTPTSSVIYLANDSGINNTGVNYVCYAWAPIAGYSAFGSYTGNGSADGPFVYTGFQPRWLMIKVTNTTDNWYLIDTARQTYNVIGNTLAPNLNNAEFSLTIADVLSNGFKIRNSGSALNANGNTVIYAAFASNPFKYANAF
jgi:hypothetical protein